MLSFRAENNLDHLLIKNDVLSWNPIFFVSSTRFQCSQHSNYKLSDSHIVLIVSYHLTLLEGLVPFLIEVP